MTGHLTPGVLCASALLAVGLALRGRLGWLRRMNLPAAAIGGVAGVIAIQATQRLDRWPDAAAFAKSLAAEWSTWPGTLIAIVFAALLLEAPRAGGFGDALRRGARSAVLAWIIILGQIAIGLVVYMAAVRPARPAVPATFGQLLEVSWAGGPGSAAGMGAIYAGQGFAAGRDLAFFLSTVGLIYGVISGLAFVNLAIRRGWVKPRPTGVASAGAVEREAGVPAGGRLSDAIEPLAVQVVILAAAYAVGLGLQRLFFAAAALVLAGPSLDAASNVPLFLFTLLAGWIVRRAMGVLGVGGLIDLPQLRRLTGVAMEFLIVAGIAAIRIDSLGTFVGPVLLLLAGAAAWSTVCLLVLSRQLLPAAYWFELGLLNFGFSTANTPQGMMLLRIVDPALQSGAAEDYAVAAPLSAPFVGGGIITFVALPMALQRTSPGAVLAGLLVAMTGLYFVGRRLARGA